MGDGTTVALVDGEHHPSVVRAALDELERERGLAGVVFCGGEEKVGQAVLDAPDEHYGRPVMTGDPELSLRRLAGGAAAVVDLADEPIVPAPRKLRLAALALHLGLAYEAPGVALQPPRYEDIGFGGARLAVIGTGKRTGKTAVAGHWARLLAERGLGVVIVSMGRGGPPEPQLAPAGVSLADLLAIADEGRHAASDYLEDAALAGVAAVGCRRIGGGLAGIPFLSNVVEGARLAAEQRPDALVLEGSGSCIPPVVADRTVCVVGDPRAALGELGPYRLLRADLALVTGDPGAEALDEIRRLVPGRVMRCELRLEPVEPVPAGAAVAVFTTGATRCAGVEPVLVSTNLARRSKLGDDLQRALAEGADMFLTEIKAAGIDTVATLAREQGIAMGFLRNRPVGADADLDEELLRLVPGG